MALALVGGHQVLNDLHLWTKPLALSDTTQIAVVSGPSPQITSFSASSTSISSGTPVTLSWQVSNASYVIVSPAIGATRATTASVSPTASTTYTLYATNAYGQTTASVSITVH